MWLVEPTSKYRYPITVLVFQHVLRIHTSDTDILENWMIYAVFFPEKRTHNLHDMSPNAENLSRTRLFMKRFICHIVSDFDDMPPGLL
jgi:hypothetical protein